MDFEETDQDASQIADKINQLPSSLGCQRESLALPDTETGPGDQPRTGSMVVPYTDHTQQHLFMQRPPSLTNFPRLSFVDPSQLKPIDLSMPISSVTLDPKVAEMIMEMNTNRMSQMSKFTKPRSVIPMSHCRKQLRLARKHVLSKLGLPHWSEEKKLLTAVRNADVNTVVVLLQDGVDPNASDNKRRTSLHIAASQGLDEIANHLMAARADPNRQDILGNSPLHLAVCRGDTRTVNILLRSGADINQKDNIGRTPLCIVRSRLGTLRKDKNISTDKLISECQMISDILKVHCHSQQVITTALESNHSGPSVDALCSMIKNISTREQVDEIADNMIDKMSQLCILNNKQNKKDTEMGYVLSIL